MMRREEYRIMRRLEDTYWWHRGMRDILDDMLVPYLEADDSLLDVGCGTGGNLATLSLHCETTGIDIHPEAVRLSRERGLKNIHLADGTRLPFTDATFTHATCCSVLQNIPDDQQCLHEIFRVLRPEGLLFVAEQSYPLLWNRHDVSQGAIRRYSRRDLETRLGAAGFVIEDFFYAIKTVLPMIALVRLARKVLQPPGSARTDETRSDLFSLPRPVNEALYRIFRMENRSAAAGRLPAGLAMIALARKPDTPVAAVLEARESTAAS